MHILVFTTLLINSFTKCSTYYFRAYGFTILLFVVFTTFSIYCYSTLYMLLEGQVVFLLQ